MGSRVSVASTSLNDSEKVSVNVGFVDLGQIDLLVQDGFYSTRTDFIRTAIRNQLERQDATLRKSVQRNEFELGLRTVLRNELETLLARKQMLNLRVIGMASIASDVPLVLARKTIGSIRVLGALRMEPELRRGLHDRIL